MKRQDPKSLVILVVVLIPYLTDHQDSAKNSPSFFFALFLRKSIIFIFFTGPLGGGSSITKTQYCSFYRICQIHLQFFCWRFPEILKHMHKNRAHKMVSQGNITRRQSSVAHCVWSPSGWKSTNEIAALNEWAPLSTNQRSECPQCVNTEHQQIVFNLSRLKTFAIKLSPSVPDLAFTLFLRATFFL